MAWQLYITREVRLALLAITVIVILCYTLPMQEYISTFVEWVNDLPVLLGAAAFIAVYALAVILFLPAMVLSISAGFIWPFARALLVVNVGATLGGTVALVLGQRVFRSTVASLVQKYPIFASIDSALAQSGWKLVVLLRVSPLIPYNVLNYAMAFTSIDALTYSWASFVGMIPQSALCVYLGSAAKSLSDVFEKDENPTTVVVGLVATVLSAILITYVVNKELKKALARGEQQRRLEELEQGDLPRTV